MKTTTTIFGALLLLSTAAYGLGTESASTSPAQSAASGVSSPDQKPTAAGNAPLPTTDQLRARLSATGVDPDSEQGQILMRWFTKLMGEPGWRVAIAKGSTGRGILSMPFSADDRLRILQLFNDAATEPSTECRLSVFQTTDFFTVAKTASPRLLEDVLEAAEIVSQAATSPPPPEQYTLVDLLNAEARVKAKPTPTSGTHAYPAGQCGTFARIVDSIVALPEPTRRYATYEVFRTMSGHKTAAQTVIADPSAYLDDEFDERQLPESLKRGLSADGSRPLPYARLIFDAEWVNKTTPADNKTFKNVFINRRNNGVIAELTSSPTTAPIWSDFVLDYGVANLRTQTVSVTTAESELGTLDDNATLAAANRDVVPGINFDIAVPQPPSKKGMKAEHYEMGESVPASTIFPSLTGAAVKFTGTEIGNDQPARWQGVWLADYRVFWTQSIDDEDGHTEVAVHNVTIEGASQ